MSADLAFRKRKRREEVLRVAGLGLLIVLALAFVALIRSGVL